MELASPLKRVYWETTAGCNLRCIHCRRQDILTKGSPDELTTGQAKQLIDELAQIGKPVLILSGGEPLFRKDIFEIARYGKERGLALGIATNGTLVSSRIAAALKDAGIYYAAISLDGVRAITHDHFRGRGNFDRAVEGFKNLKAAGIKVQVNFTVTRQNIAEVPVIYKMASDMGACALYLFLLVPVGCGVQIADSQMLSPEEVEAWLRWVYVKDRTGSLPIKAICAPHFYRIEKQDEHLVEVSLAQKGGAAPRRREREVNGARRGCLAAINMCFISHKGDVFPCGYLPVACGNVLKTPLSEIWASSTVLKQLRDPDLLTGKCGLCSFKDVCGGCRARAYYASQSVLAEEPFCTYEPA
ncbi:MAG: radical SAM protein [Elusimicrobia bacterium]|nr:radical SAM protein [Elusimicrobiota bacterium]